MDIKKLLEGLRESLLATSGIIKSFALFVIVLLLGLTFLIIALCLAFLNEFLHIMEKIGEYQEPYYVRDGIQLLTYSLIAFYFYVKIKEWWNSTPVGHISLEEKEVFYTVYRDEYTLGYGITLRNITEINNLQKKTKLSEKTIKRIILDDFEIFEDGHYYPDFKKVPLSVLGE